MLYSGHFGICQKLLGWNENIWKIKDYKKVKSNENDIKKAIIEKGPVTAEWENHLFVLIGFKKSPVTGNTIWIARDSRGLGTGDNGYWEIEDKMNKMVYYIDTPYFTSNPNQYKINCVDKDGDGYYNWGISSIKPASCPAISKAEKDCDDSNSSLGGFDKQLNCKVI
jgi:hypothetical protein